MKECYPESPVAVGNTAALHKDVKIMSIDARIEKPEARMMILMASRVMEALLSVGLYPFDKPPTDRGSDKDKTIFDDVMHHLCFRPMHHEPELLAGDYVECGSWVTPGSVQNCGKTGRILRLGEPVWLHDRDSGKHPVVAKGILVRCDSDDAKSNIREENGKCFVYSASYSTVYPIEGEVNCGGGKLWCVEPIAEADLLKSVDEIQAERAAQ